MNNLNAFFRLQIEIFYVEIKHKLKNINQNNIDDSIIININ